MRLFDFSTSVGADHRWESGPLTRTWLVMRVAGGGDGTGMMGASEDGVTFFEEEMSKGKDIFVVLHLTLLKSYRRWLIDFLSS